MLNARQHISTSYFHARCSHKHTTSIHLAPKPCCHFTLNILKYVCASFDKHMLSIVRENIWLFTDSVFLYFRTLSQSHTHAVSDLVFCGELGISVQQVRSPVCPRPRLSSVQSHISWRHVPSPASGSPLKFQNKPQTEAQRERERHVAAAPLGREGDYGVLRPSLILQFSSPRLLPSLPLSCQNKKSLRPWWRGHVDEENWSFKCTVELDALYR